MDGSIDMNVDGLFKKCSLASFPKIYPNLCQFECQKQSKIASFNVLHLDVTCRTL